MLRVIGGSARGRLLKVPRGRYIRPTSDRVRESIFNIVGHSFIKGVKFLDLFAGTGAVGIEAISRGAEYVTFVESNTGHVKVIHENIGLCGFKISAEVIYGDVILVIGRLLSHKPAYDVIFIDPPYSFKKWDTLLSNIIKNVKLCDYGFLIIEHSSKVYVPDKLNNLSLHGKYVYGDTTLTVYRKVSETENVKCQSSNDK
jgi:16S rRNA (guanine(966)-N(2))-methyltransferase RsmD